MQENSTAAKKILGMVDLQPVLVGKTKLFLKVMIFTFVMFPLLWLLSVSLSFPPLLSLLLLLILLIAILYCKLIGPIHIQLLQWYHQEEMEDRLRKYYADVVRVQSAARAFFARKSTFLI